jgi:hypothetical protein
MVTATGILLGFMLNFASSWVPKAFSTHVFIESIIALCLLVCVPLLLIVLYRILSMHIPEQHVEAYYKKTLKLFIIGVSIPFMTLVIIMLRSLLNIWQ